MRHVGGTRSVSASSSSSSAYERMNFTPCEPLHAAREGNRLRPAERPSTNVPASAADAGRAHMRNIMSARTHTHRQVRTHARAAHESTIAHTSQQPAHKIRVRPSPLPQVVPSAPYSSFARPVRARSHRDREIYPSYARTGARRARAHFITFVPECIATEYI